MKILKIIMMLVVMKSSIFANEYFAKLEPLESFIIKSSLSGEVVYLDEQLEGKMVDDAIVLKLDSKVDKIELEQTKTKIKIYKNIIKIEKKVLNKFKKMRSKSQIEKDNQNIKVLNLENQIADLITKKAMLEDKISKKIFRVQNKYISEIVVKKGDFITTGAILYKAQNLTKAKLDIYIPIDKATSIKNKVIYIDGKPTSYKISKLYAIADDIHISSYKCEIIVDAPSTFSKLVKIEFK